jgi:hypothetical protein
MIVRGMIVEMSCSNERMAGLGEKAVYAPKTRPGSFCKQSAESNLQWEVIEPDVSSWDRELSERSRCQHPDWMWIRI